VKHASFSGVVLSGHKQDAVEVPFSPAERWGIRPQRVGPRRLGYAVHGTVEGVPFDSHIVARSRRFWLLLEPSFEALAGIHSGASVKIVLRVPDGGA